MKRLLIVLVMVSAIVLPLCSFSAEADTKTPTAFGNYTKSADGNYLTKVVSNNSRDTIKVTIGSTTTGKETATGIIPMLNITRWDEVSFAITPTAQTLEISNSKISTSGDKVNFDTAAINYSIYSVSDGMEYDIILKNKPLSNIISFNLNTSGLVFYYQPPLTDKYKNGYCEEFGTTITVNETTVSDSKTGQVFVRQPEDVVGSYAVYMAEEKINYVGGNIYGCGKVGHIYRPEITDAKGNTVWGSLHIENDTLSVTIPQDFLDKATYPISHAAGLTFGYTTLGSVDYGAIAKEGSDTSITNGMAFTSASDGTLDKITVGLDHQSASENIDVCAVIYREDSAGADSHDLVVLIERTGLSVTTTATFYDFTASSEGLVADDYILGAIGDGSDMVAAGADLYWVADSGFSDLRRYYELTTGASGYTTRKNENPWTEIDQVFTYKYSIYATYTPASSSVYLTTSSSSGGNVTTPGEGTYNYSPSTVVNISATADANYAFLNWSGNTTDIGDVNAASTNISMGTSNKTATANFEFVSVIAITNTPNTWLVNGITGKGTLSTNTTYYSNPLGDTTAPSATVDKTECRFTVTNASSNVPLDLYITFSNFSGGDTMDNSNDGTNGATTFGAYAWYEGMTYSNKVIAKTIGSSIFYNEWTGTTLNWSVELKTRTDAWTTATNSTATITITAVED